MSFEIAGKVVKIYPTEQKSATFQAREFVIEIQDGNYPQFVKFQLVQDKCNLADPYKEGDEIKVWFDLRGRQWQDKFFTNLNAWRIEAAQGEVEAGGTPQEPFGEVTFPEVSSEPKLEGDNGADDDLPF